MKGHRSKVSVCCLLLVLSMGYAAFATDSVITESTVVQWFVAGLDEQEIIKRIESSTQHQFSGDPEVLEEMRRAGIPENVLELIESLTEQPSQVEPDALQFKKVTLNLVPIEASESTTLVHAPFVTQPFTWPENLQQPKNAPAAQDFAFFIFCLEDTHAPDYWQKQLKDGRILFGAPRHRLLYWQADAEIVEANAVPFGSKLKRFFRNLQPSVFPLGLRTRLTPRQIKKGFWFQLSLPNTLELELQEDTTHQLQAGFAVRIEDKFWSIIKLSSVNTDLTKDLRLGGWVDTNLEKNLIWVGPTQKNSNSDGLNDAAQ